MTAGTRKVAQTAHAVLSGDRTFQTLALQMDRMLATQSVLTGQWPNLRLRVLAIREDTLAIAVPNQAIGARCRQLEPSMIAALRPLHPGLMTIRFRQDPALSNVRPVVSRKQPISAQALASLDAGLAEMHAGPLRDALARLVGRRKQGR